MLFRIAYFINLNLYRWCISCRINVSKINKLSLLTCFKLFIPAIIYLRLYIRPVLLKWGSAKPFAIKKKNLK